jgi:hypothetical protein
MLRQIASIIIVLFLAGAASAQDACIGNVFYLPPQPTPPDTITIVAEIGPSALDVTLVYRVSSDWNQIPMSCIDDTCRAAIGPFPANTHIDYYIHAHDSVGNACNSPYEAPFSFYSIIVGDYHPCPYLPGDINNSGRANGLDVVYFVSYLKGGPPPPRICYNDNGPLFVAADINGDCAVNGIDIVFFILYLKGGNWLSHCPNYPPEG